MNCGDWEERIALYAGGDASPAEAVQVERHLAECPGCRGFAHGMRQALAALQDAHTDLPMEAQFAAVRARVMERVRQKRRPVWVYAGAAAAVVLAALAGIRMEQQPVPPEPEAVCRVPAPPAEAFVIPRKAEAAVRRAAPHRHPREQVLMKLVTNDPNVVIYWIAESKGD
jgi:anti-sigma factor RsiW